MYGNLKAFAGQEAFDSYAAGLRTLLYPYLPHGGYLWIQRVVLIVALLIHFYAAVTLWARARAARTTRYVMHKRQVQTYSSRTMRWGGLIILAFIIFHLLQFTTLTINVGGTFDSPYQRLVAAFGVWYVYLAYLVAIVLLTMHVRHGVWSAAQTLGQNNRRRQRGLNLAAYVVAGLLLVGFMAPPTAILLGFVK
jgi:succinate dehydrogenase / fumarate reductase cytochrome b subunit